MRVLGPTPGPVMEMLTESLLNKEQDLQPSPGPEKV